MEVIFSELWGKTTQVGWEYGIQCRALECSTNNEYDYEDGKILIHISHGFWYDFNEWISLNCSI